VRKRAPVVDCHALLGKGTTWANPPRAVDYGVTELLERGEQAGIDIHCVMSPRNETYREANKRIAAFCEQHAGKLTGLAVHSPQREAGRLRELLSEEVRRMGLRGVRCDGHPTRELLDAAQDLKIAVIYYPERGRDQALGRYFHMPATAYPKLNFILPHIGEYRSLSWQVHLEAIDLARRYRNVYVDTSGLGSLKYMEMAARELPVEKLLFGTHAPEHDPRVEKEALRLLKLTHQAHEKVAGSNVTRLLGI